MRETRVIRQPVVRAAPKREKRVLANPVKPTNISPNKRETEKRVFRLPERKITRPPARVNTAQPSVKANKTYRLIIKEPYIEE